MAFKATPTNDDQLRAASMHEERKLPAGFFEAKCVSDGRLWLIRVDDVSVLEQHLDKRGNENESCSIWCGSEERLVQLTYEKVIELMIARGQ